MSNVRRRISHLPPWSAARDTAPFLSGPESLRSPNDAGGRGGPVSRRQRQVRAREWPRRGSARGRRRHRCAAAGASAAGHDRDRRDKAAQLDARKPKNETRACARPRPYGSPAAWKEHSRAASECSYRGRSWSRRPSTRRRCRVPLRLKVTTCLVFRRLRRQARVRRQNSVRRRWRAYASDAEVAGREIARCQEGKMSESDNSGTPTPRQDDSPSTADTHGMPSEAFVKPGVEVLEASCAARRWPRRGRGRGLLPARDAAADRRAASASPTARLDFARGRSGRRRNQRRADGLGPTRRGRGARATRGDRGGDAVDRLIYAREGSRRNRGERPRSHQPARRRRDGGDRGIVRAADVKLANEVTPTKSKRLLIKKSYAGWSAAAVRRRPAGRSRARRRRAGERRRKTPRRHSRCRTEGAAAVPREGRVASRGHQRSRGAARRPRKRETRRGPRRGMRSRRSESRFRRREDRVDNNQTLGVDGGVSFSTTAARATATTAARTPSGGAADDAPCQRRATCARTRGRRRAARPSGRARPSTTWTPQERRAEHLLPHEQEEPEGAAKHRALLQGARVGRRYTCALDDCAERVRRKRGPATRRAVRSLHAAAV